MTDERKLTCSSYTPDEYFSAPSSSNVRYGRFTAEPLEFVFGCVKLKE